MDKLIHRGELAVQISFGGGFHQVIILRKKITKKHSRQEEVLVFLKKNNIAYEEKYLWECFLPPLWGLIPRLQHYPRLAPWAAFLRRFAAGGNDHPM